MGRAGGTGVAESVVESIDRRAIRRGRVTRDEIHGTAAPSLEVVPEPVEGYVTGGFFSTPVVVDGVVYAGALDGRLYAIEE